jgi:flagellar basal-body rod protein FlgF
MASGIYTAMLGARAQEHTLESVNNNLANVNTPGFKRQASMYREIHADVERQSSSAQAEGVHRPIRYLPDDRIAGVMEERFTHFDQGALRQTGNSLDLALEGDGFFVVQGQNGPAYTRNGTFTLAPDGTLISAANGGAVLDTDGQPIRIASPGASVSITREGIVQAGAAKMGQLAVVKFDDPRLLERQGDSEWKPADPQLQATPVDDPIVHQGWLEGSNVNAVSTMTLMVKTSRLFELNNKMIQSYKQMDSQSAQELGRTV